MSSVEIKLKTYIDFSGTETPKMPFLTKKKMGNCVSEDERRPLNCNNIHIHSHRSLHLRAATGTCRSAVGLWSQFLAASACLRGPAEDAGRGQLRVARGTGNWCVVAPPARAAPGAAPRSPASCSLPQLAVFAGLSLQTQPPRGLGHQRETEAEHVSLHRSMWTKLFLSPRSCMPHIDTSQYSDGNVLG